MLRTVKFRHALVWLMIALPLAGAASSARQESQSPSAEVTPRCAVWLREASFAASVEKHDAAAFASHLAKGAVFINGRPPHLHGEAEVAAGWAGIVAGDGLILRWHPEFVAIGGDGRTALSRGPFTMERVDAPAAQSAAPALNPADRFRIGTFQSVWTKDGDGQWKVMFDGGGPPPQPATEAEAKAMQASWQPDCPLTD